MKQIYLFILFCILTFVSFGQRPRKIYSLLSEKMYPEALHELNKFDSQKKYDKDDLILFIIAKSLLMIEKGVGMYNPIKSFNDFNNIQINSDIEKSIYKFLEKYSLSHEIILSRIHREIYIEAKKLNTVESYENAIEICSPEYKNELLNLLEIANYNKGGFKE